MKGNKKGNKKPPLLREFCLVKTGPFRSVTVSTVKRLIFSVLKRKEKGQYGGTGQNRCIQTGS